jgi:hypothetical protein
MVRPSFESLCRAMPPGCSLRNMPVNRIYLTETPAPYVGLARAIRIKSVRQKNSQTEKYEYRRHNFRHHLPRTIDIPERERLRYSR